MGVKGFREFLKVSGNFRWVLRGLEVSGGLGGFYGV